MDIFKFGSAKLKLQDIDPLYTALVQSGLSIKKLKAFTLAEVAFDHAGLAAKITEAGDFWEAMYITANQTIRGAPRRYFRGALAGKSIAHLQNTYKTPEALIDSLVGHFTGARQVICDYWPGWGPCAAFKICDMAERVCGVKIDFSGLTPFDVCSNDQVRKGFDKACAVSGIEPDKLLGKLAAYKWPTQASPRYDRPLGVQEFETMLCYYSHDDAHNKHLPGMDSIGIQKELEGYGKLAAKLISKLPHNKEPL